MEGLRMRAPRPGWGPCTLAEKAQLRRMSAAERVEALLAGELTYRECCYVAARWPEQVPLVDGEFCFLACLDPAVMEAAAPAVGRGSHAGERTR